MENPQTVEFEVEFSWNYLYDNYKDPKIVKNLSFEKMHKIIRLEKRRRKKTDRPTDIRWRTVLTPYGIEKIKTDDFTRRSHANLDTNWKNW